LVKSDEPHKTTTLVATTKPEIEDVTVVGKPTKAITGNLLKSLSLLSRKKEFFILGLNDPG
jgi:hypothetical protein